MDFENSLFTILTILNNNALVKRKERAHWLQHFLSFGCLEINN